MKIFAFIVFIVAATKLVYATDKYFEFMFKNTVLSADGVAEIEILFNLNNIFANRFRVRPVSEANFPKIWDEERQLWVFGNSLWSNMPKLSNNTKLKFENPNFLSTQVYLQVQDTQTSEIYKTSKQKIWSKNWFIEYLSKINEGLFKMLE